MPLVSGSYSSFDNFKESCGYREIYVIERQMHLGGGKCNAILLEDTVLQPP